MGERGEVDMKHSHALCSSLLHVRAADPTLLLLPPLLHSYGEP